MFGLNSNAEFSVGQDKSNIILHSLLVIQSGKEVQTLSLGTDFSDLLVLIKKELPKLLPIENFVSKIVKLYKDLKSALTNPMNTVVL